MAITVAQAWGAVELELDNGTGGGSSSATVHYIVDGTDDEKEACTSAYEFAPASYSDIPKKSVSVSERLTDTCWKIEVAYGVENTGSNDSEDDEPTESFDCSGGTKHMTHAISQKKVYPGGSSDDAGGGIGWNGKSGADAEFSGVDVPIADMRETYTKTISRSMATRTSYKRKVAALVGKVNNRSFKGWDAGEVMFLGCSYSTPARNASKVTVTYNFRISPNESRCQVAGHNCGKKQGFEYLWAISRPERDSDGKPKVDVQGIYKSVVCESGNFNDLGL